jgi:hypothetical protein
MGLNYNLIEAFNLEVMMEVMQKLDIESCMGHLAADSEALHRLHKEWKKQLKLAQGSAISHEKI